MSGVKIDYRGYEIRFGENPGTWSSFDFSVDDIDINKVKAAIDKQLLKIRKGAGVDAILLDGYDPIVGVPVKIIEYLHPITERSGSFGTGERKVVGHTVAVSGMFKGNDRVSRRQEPLSRLAVPCDFTLEMLAKIKANSQEIARIRDANEKLKKQIGCISLDAIETLRKVAAGDLPEDAA